jgi:uncharacterized membrane protein YoaK (UPF0700 family)
VGNCHAVPSVDSSLVLKLLPTLLSVIAGSADVISFLGLKGLFVAHITGNLIILAARVVTNLRVTIAPILSVPVFIAALALTRVLAAWLERRSIGSLQVLLLLQFVLLAGFLAFGVAAGTHTDPNAPAAVWSGMLGVAAMAVQNAMVQISLRGAPSTAVMTTNITRFMMDAGEVFLGSDPDVAAAARRRASRTWPAIVGFAAGGAAGAALYAAMGISSMVLPAALALLAVVAGHLALRG